MATHRLPSAVDDEVLLAPNQRRVALSRPAAVEDHEAAVVEVVGFVVLSVSQHLFFLAASKKFASRELPINTGFKNTRTFQSTTNLVCG